MTCLDCGFELPIHVDRCPSCFRDVGAPNVRAAGEAEERHALERRLAAARVETSACGTELILERFCTAVRASRAVLCRPLAQVQELVSSDNALYATFYQLIHSGVRSPQDNKFDRFRQSVDANLFPYYYDHIRFAALSLDDRGLDSYGGFTVVLRSDRIEARATVFEENSFLFFERHQLEATRLCPPGYRATWAERDLLAAAKLHAELRPDTLETDFPTILLRSSGDTAADDFVEVHIYGSFNRRSVERVLGKQPAEKADQILVDDLRRKLRGDGLNIPIETYA